MPRRDRRHHDAKSLLYEVGDGRMVCNLGMDPSAFAPRRDDIKRYAWSHSPGTNGAGDRVTFVKEDPSAFPHRIRNSLRLVVIEIHARQRQRRLSGKCIIYVV